MTIKQNMTIKAEKALIDLKEDKTHNLPCYCACCLYSQYKKQPRKKGRKFGMLTFFLYWLAYEVKKASLIEKGKAEIIFKDGREFLRVDPNDFERVPYIEEAEKILDRLYDLDLDLASCFFYLRKYERRTRKPNFLKLIRELTNEIWWDWIRTQPPEKKAWDKNKENLSFAQKVADFMYLQPKKEVSRYVLLKHFSNKRKDDIVRIHNILELNYGIQFKDKQGYRAKSTIYYSFMKSSRGRYWSVGE